MKPWGSDPNTSWMEWAYRRVKQPAVCTTQTQASGGRTTRDSNRGKNYYFELYIDGDEYIYM